MKYSGLCGAGLVIFLTANAYSQPSNYDPKLIPIYDAGALTRQAEQALQQSQMQRNAQRRESLPPPMHFTDDTVVTPKQIKFLGAKLLSNEQLQAVVQPYLGRPLNQHELEHLTDAVIQAYRRAGWLVRVYIPQQDLSQTDLHVQVLENMPSSAR
jgi:hemolysin activation/secretion protein